jgi:hypothetical protein
MRPWPQTERRALRRVPRALCPAAAARLRPGGDVEIVDLSAHGTRIDRAPRLLPGTAVQLHVSAAGWGTTVTAHVVHCQVSDLSGEGGAKYRAGLRFDRPLEALLGAAGIRGP